MVLQQQDSTTHREKHTETQSQTHKQRHTHKHQDTHRDILLGAWHRATLPFVFSPQRSGAYWDALTNKNRNIQEIWVNLLGNQNREHQQTLQIRGQITGSYYQTGNQDSSQGMFLAFVSTSCSTMMRGLLYLPISSCCSLSILSNCSITSSSLT